MTSMESRTEEARELAAPARGSGPEYVFSNTVGQWATALALWSGWFVFFMWYHKVRGKDYSLFTANKCVAIASALCIASALALGPLGRLSPAVNRLRPLRRALGLVGAFLCVPHVLMTLFALPERLPRSLFWEHPLILPTGIPALVLLTAIAAASFPRVARRLGGRRWWRLQKASSIAGLLVLAHLLSLGKAPGWLEWVKTLNRPLPPGALTTSTIYLLVFGLRLGQPIASARSKADAPSGGD
jgi:DMSO/TMAO reductase YedYZ heme-binding membrane subunit